MSPIKIGQIKSTLKVNTQTMTTSSEQLTGLVFMVVLISL